MRGPFTINIETFKAKKFWARRSFASIVGIDEQTVRNYIRQQENEDRRFDQLDFIRINAPLGLNKTALNGSQLKLPV